LETSIKREICGGNIHIGLIYEKIEGQLNCYEFLKKPKRNAKKEKKVCKKRVPGQEEFKGY
jgi:hypothetical protein